MVSSAEGRTLKKANPNTIQDKFLVGYQGWFTCAGDGPPVHRGHHGWLHWFDRPIPDGGRPNTDIWPDVSEYSPSELYSAPGLTMQDGRPALLFSSRNAKTVRRHFHWMAMHGVDGAFLQRFAGQCEVDGRTEGGNADVMRLRDEVGDRVREAAEREGRVFAIMYDVSGVPADRIEKVIKVDWAHLVHDKGVLDSPNYLREDGKPVIALWGFGFSGRGHSPAVVRSIVRHIRVTTPGGAYVMAGAPTHWQTLRGDADPNPEFLSVWYNEFDAISPWTVGRFHNEETADAFAREKVKKDIEALKNNSGERKVDYIPVVFPGFSGVNLSQGKWRYNEVPRDGGRFLWRQLYNVRKAGVRIIYGAMWDEYDEGTAYMPVVSKKRELPIPGDFLALDGDGYDLPPDWFMRICGFAGEILREERPVHETFPVKDLQDYWTSRPKYEPIPAQPEASSSSAGPSESIEDAAQTYQEWCEQEKEGMEDLPPPPYTLEAENRSVSQIQQTQSRPPQQMQVTPPQEQTRMTQQPPVPTQNRPASLPADSTSYNLSNRPSSLGSAQASGSSQPSSFGTSGRNHTQSPPQQQPQHGHRPSSLPSSTSHQGHPNARPHGVLQAKKSSGPAPGEIFHHPQPPFPPQHPPRQPPWHTRPQQQPHESQMHGHLSPPPQNSLRPSVSVSNLNDEFGRQSLNDAPGHQGSVPHGMHSPYSPQSPNSQAAAHGQYVNAQGQPPRPQTAASQWPPPEWGVQTQPVPPRPATLPPPLHPQRHSMRPPSSPHPGSYGPPPGSMSPHASGSGFGPSPSASPLVSPSAACHTVPAVPAPGWDYGRTNAFLQPGAEPLPHASHAPHPQHMLPPRRRRSSSVASPPSAPSACPSTYPDAAAQYPPLLQPGRYNDGPERGAPGGFYMGHVQHTAQNPNPGFMFPPQTPFRPPGGSISPGQIMPTSHGPSSGRLGDVASGAYSYTLGAVDKVAGANARKRLENGIDSLSSKGTRIYQKFRD